MVMELSCPSTQAEDAVEPLLALPDPVLHSIAAWLPSADKKAVRLACRALRSVVNGAVCSLLVTDANLPLLAPRAAKGRQECYQPQQQGQEACRQESQPCPSPSSAGCPLHQIFPNLTHLCLALSPAGGSDARRVEQLRCLLRHSLPSLHCLLCLDLSLACRDVILGRTAADVYETWALVVQGLPTGRPVQLLLHPPTALWGPACGASSRAATAAAAAVAAANGFLIQGSEGCGVGGGTASALESVYGDGAVAGDDPRGHSSAVTDDCGAHSSGGGGGGGGSSDRFCLLADMISLLGARRPAAEVRLVAAPLASKRYDKPRIPSYDDLMAALAPAASGPESSRTACPVITGLVLGPESFDPGGSKATGAGAVGGRDGGGDAGRGAGGSGGGGGGGDSEMVAWLPLLAAANARVGASLEQLTLWESWPLARLLGPCAGAGDGAGGGGGRIPTCLTPASCFLGLRRLVLSDQQAVLDRDRLSAEALAPLSSLTRLSRLELASLIVNVAAAPRGSVVQGRMRSTGGGGRAVSGGGGRRGSAAAARRGGKAAAAAAARALPFTPLPQVRHLSVYHALRIIWPQDGDSMCDGGGSVGAAASAAPLAALFPGLNHLSACVTPGPPGRPASERWGYLSGLGSGLRSLHLRAVAAEDLCLQGRSEALAGLTRVRALRLSAENGKIDGIRGLSRTIACLAPGLAALRLSRIDTRGTDPRVAELVLPRLTRLDFLSCSGDLVAAFDGLALSAVRLRRLEIRECAAVRPADLQWAVDRQVGLRQLVVQDCPGMLGGIRLTSAATAGGQAAALRAALRLRPSVALSLSTTDAEEARALRRSRRRAACGFVMDADVAVAERSQCWTADDLDELW